MDVHIPVMAEEVIEHLNLKPGKIILDCTVGCGGHAELILKKILPGGKFIGIDQDDEALEIAARNLDQYKDSIELQRSNFRELDRVLKATDKIDGALFDLGVSSLHLDRGQRGFSFRYDAPLDMRMDKRSGLTAGTIVNRFRGEDIRRILIEYGEEWAAGKIARAITERRKKAPIKTTFELSKLVERASSGKRRSYKLHPATKTFLALRIAVNDELAALREGLDSVIGHMAAGSRIAVMAFHSLEDRIVKNRFRESKKEGSLEIITKRPLRPCEDEIKKNPRSRSAKLRIAERN